MIHVYKKDGDWAHEDGFTYDVKAITPDKLADYEKQGYKKSLDEIKPKKRATKVKAK